MKKIIYILTIGILILSYGCESDLLNPKNLYTTTTDNYYKTPDQIKEAMAGVYNALYVPTAADDEHIVATLLDDVTFAGGGSDDTQAKNIAGFVDPTEDTHKGLWLQTYRGIARVNAIIESVSKNDFSQSFNTAAEAETFKNGTLGEAHFMRGFLMFRAARFFGGMPLILSTVGPYNVPRASFSETFSQIANDFKKAADLLPNIKADGFQLADYGHANRWVAKAYLAKAYMFYTGYMTNIEKKATDAIALPENGGNITKNDIIAHLNDIVVNSGYELVSDFRNLWPYSYVNQAAGQNILPWSETNHLNWAGQDGPKSTIGTGNKEVMFALRYANADWSTGEEYRNWGVLFFGVRKNSMIPFGEGWGWGTVRTDFYQTWSNNDTRKDGSVLVMGDPAQGTGDYANNQGDHETGLFIKKYTPLQFSDNGNIVGLFYKIYGSGANDYILWHAQDFIYLRFADVLLMQSELTQTAEGLNKVHKRAYGEHHTDLAYSLEALKKERLYEFAFEGIHWFDLVRWGDVENAANSYFGKEIDVVNEGVATKHKEVYRIETKGLRPIPESEIKLSGGVYTQNPGW